MRRRLSSIPAALLLIAVVGAGAASADPINGRNTLFLVGTCDNGNTTSVWVTPAAGHAVMDAASTTNTVTLALQLYSNDELVVDFALPEAGHVPARLTTECSGYVLGDPTSTFWSLSLITPAH